MRKIVKKWGDSLVVVFDKEDKRINNIEEGDIVDIKEENISKGKKGDKDKDGL